MTREARREWLQNFRASTKVSYREQQKNIKKKYDDRMGCKESELMVPGCHVVYKPDHLSKAARRKADYGPADGYAVITTRDERGRCDLELKNAKGETVGYDDAHVYNMKRYTKSVEKKRKTKQTKKRKRATKKSDEIRKTKKARSQ